MNSRVFIGRLAYEATETDVENFLSKFGKVGNIKIKKGYGFAVSIFVLYRTAAHQNFSSGITYLSV